MKITFCLFLIAFSLNAVAQKWTNYNSANTSTQLSNNLVNEVSVDLDGSLWFVTAYGISHFDGDATWVNYTKEDGLASNIVNTVFIDKDGNKWFGTNDGVSKFDGSHWLTFGEKDGLMSHYIYAIAQDNQGNLWFGTEHGVYKYDGINWDTSGTSEKLGHKEISSLAVDIQNNIWFGTDGDGVWKFDGLLWTNFNSNNSGLGNSIMVITIDSNNHLWFGSSKGVSEFDGSNWTIYDEKLNDKVISILIDKLGNKWFGTSSGVWKFDGFNWTSFTTKDGLAGDVVKDIAIDDKGNKWFVVKDIYRFTGGVSKYNDANWTTYKATGLTDNQIGSIVIDSKGQKWFGTVKEGILVFNDTLWTNYSLENGLPGYNISSMALDTLKDIWVSTGLGVSKYDGKNWTHYTKKGESKKYPINEIGIDISNVKWLATEGGVVKFEDSLWEELPSSSYRAYSMVSDLVLSSRVKNIIFDYKGNSWTYRQASKYDMIMGKNDLLCGILKCDTQGSCTSYYATDIYTANYVFSMAVDTANNLWFGTRTGLFKYDGIKWTIFSKSDGLAGNMVYSIMIDHQGNKWCGTNEGISRFDGTSWITYNTSDGLINNNVNAIAIDSQGNKWFGTSEGVSKFEDATLDISNELLNLLSFEGAQATFEIFSNTKWNINCNQDWLTLSDTSGFNNNKITLSAKANTLSTSRSAAISITSKGISSKTVTVTQMPGSTGILDITDPYLIILPVPVIDKLVIQFSKPSYYKRVAIYSITGAEIYSSEVNNTNTEINMTQHPRGVYCIKVFSWDGGIVTKKIIKF